MRVLVFFLVSCFATNSFTQPTAFSEDSMVQKFYTINHQHLFWLSSRKNIKRASDWLNMIESADNSGLVPNKLQTNKIRAALRSHNTLNKIYKEQTDREITGFVLSFLKVLQQGNIVFDYDEFSIPRDTVYVYQLLNSKPGESVSKIVERLECKDHDYMVLKKYLHDSINVTDTLKYKEVLLAMNYRRYLTLNYLSEYIIVNIPAAEAVYYQNNLPVLKMRTVVGKKKTPTPLIASYITSIVTFPYWNVPRTIAVDEILPKVQKDENYLEQKNFDVVDDKGNIIEDSALNWKDFNAKTFPYYFRQSTGADNDLGVLKFNLQNPFSIFLHSTGLQSAFTRDFRFLSHGCIRLEKPFDLANALLRGNIDIEELKKGKSNTKSNTIMIPYKIPTFIIYMPVQVAGEKITFLRDVYGLVK